MGDRLTSACSSCRDANTMEPGLRAGDCIGAEASEADDDVRREALRRKRAAHLLDPEGHGGKEGPKPSTETQSASVSKGQGSISGVKEESNLTMRSFGFRNPVRRHRPGPQAGNERKGAGVRHPGRQPLLPGLPVQGEDRALRLLFFRHRDGRPLPPRVLLAAGSAGAGGRR